MVQPGQHHAQLVCIAHEEVPGVLIRSACALLLVALSVPTPGIPIWACVLRGRLTDEGQNCRGSVELPVTSPENGAITAQYVR